MGAIRFEQRGAPGLAHQQQSVSIGYMGENGKQQPERQPGPVRADHGHRVNFVWNRWGRSTRTDIGAHNFPQKKSTTGTGRTRPTMVRTAPSVHMRLHPAGAYLFAGAYLLSFIPLSLSAVSDEAHQPSPRSGPGTQIEATKVPKTTSWCSSGPRPEISIPPRPAVQVVPHTCQNAGK
jgi:hypothetical protein